MPSFPFTVLSPQGAFSVEMYHFPVPLQSVPITVVYGCDKSCDPHMTHLEATSELMQAQTIHLYMQCNNVTDGSFVRFVQ